MYMKIKKYINKKYDNFINWLIYKLYGDILKRYNIK